MFGYDKTHFTIDMGPMQTAGLRKAAESCFLQSTVTLFHKNT
jgi:hypothetical protein